MSAKNASVLEAKNTELNQKLEAETRKVKQLEKRLDEQGTEKIFVFLINSSLIGTIPREYEPGFRPKFKNMLRSTRGWLEFV